MRRFLFSLILILLGELSFSAEIQNLKAQIVALNWMNTLVDMPYDMKDIAAVYIESENDIPVYYIVSFNPVGWVIVSGIGAAEPILGYSTEDVFNAESMPPQAKAWMKGLHSEISSAVKNKVTPSEEVKKRWSKYGTKVLNSKSLALKQSSQSSALLSTNWNQGRYFNEMAPSDVSSSAGNGHVWIGCVATAMAQVMKYWSYPGNGMGYHSYVHSEYGTLSADFQSTSYNWSAMTNNVNSQNTEVQQICYHAAIAVDMDFGTSSSGAYLADANTGLINYFKYNNTIFEAEKSRWNNAEWIAQLKREIDAGRPVIYSGYNSSYTSGHAWVCDGYSAGDYFHFNWGWSGSYNGYFLLSSISPASYDFSTDQAALFSIEPVLPSSISIPYSQSFESGAGELSLMGVSETTSEEVHTGSESLRLGKQSIVSYATDAASLCFVVPAEAELNFWVKRSTPEISASNQQIAYLMPQFGSTPLITIYDGDFNDEDWVSYNVDLSSYTGQIVRLLFVEKVNDYTKQQWMYIDDISISGLSSNLPPYTPASPIPSINQDYISLSPTFHWNGGDPNGDNLKYYIYLGTQSNPPLLDSTSNNYFTSPVLTHTTTYYWKIIASDGNLTTEGPVWSFKTMGIPPDMGNCGITNLSSKSATICGEIVNQNGTTISSRGICWTQTSLPSLSTEHMVSSDTSAVFTCNIDSLLPYTLYNYNAFANSNQGLAYSQTLSVRTLPDIPELEISEVKNIFRTSATVVGVINQLNDASISRRGVVWSETKGFTPSLGTFVYEEGNWQNSGSFQINLVNIPGPGNFYVRIFAQNSAGISYSDELKFTTPNFAPVIDLDANNSSKAGDSNFLGSASEQLSGGKICDNDVVISDPDGDEITGIVIEIQNPVDSQKEILSVVDTFENLVITGNESARLELSVAKSFSYLQWQEILKNVEYINLLDSPHPEIQRKILIKVFDEIDWSNLAIAYLNIISINDPPVVQIIPKISIEPVFGSNASVVPGTWADLLDECNGNFTFHYYWQAKDNEGTIENIEAEDLYFLTFNEHLCGKSVRAIEEITDLNCGGDNSVSNWAASEWYPVGKASQTISIDPIPLHYFHEKIIVLKGSASSGLPLTFSIPLNNTLSISNDTIYMINSGSAVISCRQPGNDCYLPSDIAYRIITISRGSQEIIFETPLVVKYSDFAIKLPAKATSGLNLKVTSSDSTVAFSDGDSIFFRGVGDVSLFISQSGNQNYYSATPVEIKMNVTKGDQVLTGNSVEDLYYGQGKVYFKAYSSSFLKANVSSSDPSIIKIEDDSLIILGVGKVLLTISQEGNELYNRAESIQIPVTVYKGVQELSVSVIDTKKYTDEPFVPICSASSGLEVSYSVKDTSIAEVLDGKIAIKKAGETLVHFSQDGNSLWESVSKDIPLCILKADQIITFSEIQSRTFGDENIVLDAVASSGLPVNYTLSDTEVASLSGDTLKIQNAGSVLITALQEGNEQWNEATPISVMVNVEKASQTITSFLPDSILLSEHQFFVDAVASSSLPLTINSSDMNIAMVSGDTIILLNTGKVVLSISQSGDRNFFATTIDRQLIVYEPVSVPELGENLFSVYPNPSEGIFHLLVTGDLNSHSKIRITNVMGRLIVQKDLTGSLMSIDLSGYPQGVYLLYFTTKYNTVIQKLLLGQ